MPTEYYSPLHLLKAKIDVNLNIVVQMSNWSQMIGLYDPNNLYADHVWLILPIWPVQVLIVQYIVVIGSDSCLLPQYIDL